jgi:myo-inositol catabolism protein IolS
MKYREIRSSGISVSEISLGCWTLGGLNWVDGQPNGWANVDEDEVIRAVQYAIDQGVNHFDNADVYGNGRAERMLAQALDQLGLDSTMYVIASKVGHFPGTAAHAFDPLHIRSQCEQSLKNLRRDYIDIYYLHHGNFGENDEYLDGAAETVDRLKDEGKIRLIGQSAYSVADFAKTIPVVKPDVLQSWAHALDDQFIRDDGELARLMYEHDLKIVAFSPLAQGRLLDKYDPQNPPVFDLGDNRKGSAGFTREGLIKLQPVLAKLKTRFGSSIEDLAAMALNYDLAHDRVQCVIPGFRNDRQVIANLTASNKEFSAEDCEFVRKTVRGAGI